MPTATDIFFRNDTLTAFLRDINERFTVTTLADWDGGPAIVLRHDVDLDVRPAHRLARLERDCGVRSSFFVLTTCPLYNVLAAPTRRMLAEMTDWGFEIGLHFDPVVYGDVSDEALQPFIDSEAEILASVSGQPVRSVSLHNPSVHGRYPAFEGYRNAYDPRLFGEDRYLTDSRRRFAHDPRAFVERAADRAIQLLLHPLHYSEDGASYDAAMGRYVLETIDAVDANFDVNETYRQAVAPGLRHVVRDQLGRDTETPR